MGNDDGLSDSEVLERVRRDLARWEPVSVAITNYREIPSGQVFRRMTTSGLVGSGPDLAVDMFRNYSFVSGIVFDGPAARAEATDICDGTEMYQMYLGTRLIAAGGRFVAIDRVCIDKDLQLPGQYVDSYRRKPKVYPCPIVERRLPMGHLLKVVAAGLSGYHEGARRERNLVRIARQLYRYTFPFWLIEYRRVQSWHYAVGVFLGIRPARLADKIDLSSCSMLRLWAMYLSSSIAALTVPIRLFDILRPRLYKFVKRGTVG
jgi:hypothetical protein